MHLKNWLTAFRLKTLPLAFASVFLGNFLAYANGNFSISIAILSLVTTAFLQILSNLANDYGDAVNGVDNEYRIGPARAVQSGLISAKLMKKGVYFFIALSLVSGLTLLYLSFGSLLNITFLIFFVVGLLAIYAAIKYTVGKNPYGYNGLGDIFVLIFFGWVAIIGTYFLHNNELNWNLLLPSSCIGLLAVGVLNLNNMRDAAQDKTSNKITLAVRLGESKSKIYHLLLIISALICSMLYLYFVQNNFYQWLYLLLFIPILLHSKRVFDNKIPAHLDPELKKLAFSTFLFSIAFGLSLCLTIT